MAPERACPNKRIKSAPACNPQPVRSLSTLRNRLIMDNTIQENVEDLVDHIQEYIETQKELFVIGAKEKAAAAISQTVIWIVVGLFAFLGITFLSIALAMWLGHLLDSAGYGFLIVGALYGIGAALFYTFRESLLQNTLNDLFLIKFMTNHEQH